MAADEGFEPSQTESESGVLPLHQSAISSLNFDLFSLTLIKLVMLQTANSIQDINRLAENNQVSFLLLFKDS